MDPISLIAFTALNLGLTVYGIGAVAYMNGGFSIGQKKKGTFPVGSTDMAQIYQFVGALEKHLAIKKVQIIIKCHCKVIVSFLDGTSISIPIRFSTDFDMDISESTFTIDCLRAQLVNGEILYTSSVTSVPVDTIVKHASNKVLQVVAKPLVLAMDIYDMVCAYAETNNVEYPLFTMDYNVPTILSGLIVNDRQQMIRTFSVMITLPNDIMSMIVAFVGIEFSVIHPCCNKIVACSTLNLQYFRGFYNENEYKCPTCRKAN